MWMCDSCVCLYTHYLNTLNHLCVSICEYIPSRHGVALELIFSHFLLAQPAVNNESKGWYINTNNTISFIRYTTKPISFVICSVIVDWINLWIQTLLFADSIKINYFIRHANRGVCLIVIWHSINFIGNPEKHWF